MLGIVILNYNTSKDVIECVKSIKEGTRLEYIIYIVDNCSTDDSYTILTNEYRNEDCCIKIIKSDYNGGYSYGNNIGIKWAFSDGCDYIMISNPDVIYYESTIDTLLESYRSDNRIGIIGPSTPSLDQVESQLLRKVYKPSVYFFSKKPFLYLSRIFKILKTEYEYPTESDKSLFLFKGMVRGCCFVISSNLFREMSMFDDNVFLYSEEWILAKKMADRGYYCAFESKARALHKEATSTKQSGTGFQSFHLYLSAFYYLKYYEECGFAYLLFVYIQNILNFTFKSIINKSYRKLIIKFLVAQTQIFNGKKRKIGYDSMR